MAKTSRKEKYISEQTKGNKTYLLVKFTYPTSAGSKTYTKTFAVSDYPTKSACMKAAVRHRDIKRAELASVGFAEDASLTVDEIKDIYIEKKHMPVSCLKVFNQNYTKYIAPRFGHRKIKDITAIEIEESLILMRDDHSDQVIRRVFGEWKALFSTARKLRVVTSLITEEVEVPKSRYYPEERTAKTVTDEQIDIAVKGLQNFSDRESTQFNASLLAYMIIVCRQTGLRPAEVFALKRGNIDFLERTVTVDCAYGTDEKGRAIVSTKTKASVRKIPLTLTAELALKGAMSMSANEFIFTKWDGNLFTTPDVTRYLGRIEGLERFSIYSMRHQFSSDMITNNVDPRTVMELMGHTNTSMTVGVYARSDDQKKREALEELGRRH